MDLQNHSQSQLLYTTRYDNTIRHSHFDALSILGEVIKNGFKKKKIFFLARLHTLHFVKGFNRRHTIEVDRADYCLSRGPCLEIRADPTGYLSIPTYLLRHEGRRDVVLAATQSLMELDSSSDAKFQPSYILCTRRSHDNFRVP